MSDRALYEELKALPREELEAYFMRTLTMYHSEKWQPTGFYHALPDKLNGLNEQLGRLNEQLAASSGAQNRLTIVLLILTALLVVATAAQALH